MNDQLIIQKRKLDFTIPKPCRKQFEAAVFNQERLLYCTYSLYGLSNNVADEMCPSLALGHSAQEPCFLKCIKNLVSFRNSGVCIAVSGPGMERKLNRTRKMSENIRTVESKTMTTIPTQKEDITIKWIHMIINQNLLRSGKAPLDQEAIEGMTFEIIDCKSRYAILYSVGGM
jgi:hypothetical protein